MRTIEPPDTEAGFDQLVLSCINRSKPTKLAEIVTRMERKTGCVVLGMAGIHESGRRLVAAGLVKIIRTADGKFVGPQIA